MDVVVAGGGIAGLEALLALHAVAGERVRWALIAPDPDFSYRPLAVAEPFGLGHAYHVPLKRFADETGAELIIDAVVGVDDANRQAQLRDAGTQSFDALLLATGAPVAGIDDATTWWPEGSQTSMAGCCATSTRATPSGWRSWCRWAPCGHCRPTSWRS